MEEENSEEKMALPKETAASVVRALVRSTKDLAKSEIALVKADVKNSVREVGKHSAQAAIFGSLVALSVIPFLAFLVIGLGELLQGRYWLSSLLVSLGSALIGGALAYRAYDKIKNHDIDFQESKIVFSREVDAIKTQVHELKNRSKKN